MTANDERVVGIDGKPHREAPVTQLQCARVAHLQAAAWDLHTQASAAALDLGERIARGATIEDGDWYYDTALHMVRSKREILTPIPTIPEQSALDFDCRKEASSEAADRNEKESAS